MGLERFEKWGEGALVQNGERLAEKNNTLQCWAKEGGGGAF